MTTTTTTSTDCGFAYRFFSDPSHGWLRVKVAELRRLGIADDISQFSHRSADGLTAYLEEDSDATKFIQAKRERGEPMKFSESVCRSGRSGVTRHPSYR